MTDRTNTRARRAADHAARLRASGRALGGALTVAAALAFAFAAPAQASRLYVPTCEFALPDSVTVPPETAGIPVWSVKGCYSLGDHVPLADRFVIERRDGAGWRAVPFRLRLRAPDAGFEAFGDYERGALAWLAPEEGFVRGATYRLTRKATLDHAMVTTVVAVARDSAGADTGGARLVIGEPVTGPLVPEGGPYGGFPRFHAVRRDVRLVLPAAWQRYAGALCYATSVDGTRWGAAFDPDRIDQPPTIPSLGAAHELVFASCPRPTDPNGIETRSEGDRPARALAPGTHVVLMHAWIPGTSIGVSARATVTLACP